MIVNSDDELKDFYKPVSDVKYICSILSDHMDISSKDQYFDLAVLYHKSVGKNASLAYVSILKDAEDILYARITPRGLECAINMGSSLIPKENKLRFVKDISLRKSKDASIYELLTDNSIKDKIHIHDSLDEIGGMSNPDPELANDAALSDSQSAEKIRLKDYFPN